MHYTWKVEINSLFAKVNELWDSFCNWGEARRLIGMLWVSGPEAPRFKP